MSPNLPQPCAFCRIGAQHTNAEHEAQVAATLATCIAADVLRLAAEAAALARITPAAGPLADTLRQLAEQSRDVANHLAPRALADS